MTRRVEHDPWEDYRYFTRISRGYRRRVEEALAEATRGDEIAYLLNELREVEFLESRGLTR